MTGTAGVGQLGAEPWVVKDQIGPDVVPLAFAAMTRQ
jgi:hypothetical protein